MSFPYTSAGDKTKGKSVFFPPDPAAFHTAAYSPAIADELPGDETAIVDIERDDYTSEVHMSPGLCPIGRDGDVGRDGPAQIAKDRAPCAGAGDAIADCGNGCRGPWAARKPANVGI